MSWRQYLKAFVLAAPIIFFPFSRSYHLFYVLLIVCAITQAGLSVLMAEGRPVIRAAAAFGLPVVVTALYWSALKLHVDLVWIKVIGLAIYGMLLGVAALHFSNDESIREWVFMLISIAIISWVIDGAIQLLVGNNIACRFSEEPCARQHQLSLYFYGKSKLGYFLGMFALIPASWLISRQQIKLALAFMVLAAAVEAATFSRFGLMSCLLGYAVLIVVASLRLRFLSRAAILIGFPIVCFLVGAVLYQVSAPFHTRVVQTAAIFSGGDYKVWNDALSSRLDLWIPTLHVIHDNWLLGVGPGGLGEAAKPYAWPGSYWYAMLIPHAHQVILDIGAATGVIGVAAFLSFYGWVCYCFIKSCRKAISVQWAFMLIFLLMWFPLNSQQGFYSSELMLVTFFVLGMAFGFSDDHQSVQTAR